jgi:polysaccharide biosynthesis protein PelG
LIDRGSLSGALGAYLTGVAVTSAPWLLTTAVLTSLRLSARSFATGEFRIVEHTVTIVYALTVILGAPIDVVLSRHASDRLYDKRLDAIAAPLRRGLALTVMLFAVVGAAVMAVVEVPLRFAVPGTMLAVVVGAQWLMLSVCGGLSSPKLVLSAFGVGAVSSVAFAFALGRGLGMGALGYLYGFGTGQLCSLVVLLVGVLRVLPERADERERLWPAFVAYRLLAAAAFAYHLSIWADKPLLWLLAGKDAAALYTASAALAWFSVIPAFAWIYVQIETVFHQRFRAFFSSLEGGGTLASLEERADLVRAEAFRLLRGAALVQGAVTLLGFMAGPLVLAVAGLPPEGLPMYRLAMVGAAMQMMTLLTLLMLYYFDLRREALTVAIALLAAEVAATVVCWRAALPPGLGYALGTTVSCLLGLLLVYRRMRTLLVDTFQSQPFGAM